MKLQIFILLSILLLSLTNSLYCYDYYVDAKLGSDTTGDGTSGNPWKTITYALIQVESSSLDPAVINIAQGTYNTALGESFPISLIDASLKGADRNTTILDASLGSGNVITCNCIYDDLFIESLTITGGGGVFVVFEQIIIQNCNIINNTAWNGGGIAFEEAGSSRITDSYICNNTAMNCGGGIYIYACGLIIENSIIEGNYSFGDGGGLYYDWDGAIINNCLFVSNFAEEKGGGIYASGWGGIHLQNSSLIENTANVGGGYYKYQDDWYYESSIKDSIIWDNVVGSINENPENLFVTYSDIEGGFEGEGNIDEDPLFVAGPWGDYYLSQLVAGQLEQSPCVNAGSDTAANLEMDDKTTRTDYVTDDGIVDMGYHYPANPPPTPSPTITETATMTITPTLTMTATMTAFMTPTSTATTGPTFTPTPFVDYAPSLDDVNVFPSSGNQNTTFTYNVNYNDPDGGYPWISRLYINGKGRDISKNTESGNGIYSYKISGSELEIGANDYRFYFRDDEGNMVHSPASGTFSGPFVNPDATQTPTKTQTPTPIITQTQQPTKTETPTPDMTQTPTITPEPEPLVCLTITNPSDFYYNTIILSWTPILDADYYQLELRVHDLPYIFILIDNYVMIIANDLSEWQSFVNIGTISYRITAFDEDNVMIEEPTDWFDFSCHNTLNENNGLSINNNAADPGCLRVSSPPSFDYNTILLSWTPIQGVDRYLIKYRYSTWVFQGEIETNWLQATIPNQNIWNQFKNLGKIYYSITALNSFGNPIDGPTAWTSFTCK